MLTGNAVIERVRQVFGGDRAELRKLIVAERDPLARARRDRLGDQLRSATGQPMVGFRPFLDEGFEHVDDPDHNTWQLGDASAHYEVLLNEGVASGLDWDRKLCARCGGTARRCGFFVSAVLPVYIADMWYQTHSRKPRYFAFGPITKLQPAEQRMVEAAKQVLRTAGFQPLSGKLARVTVPTAVTDCRRRGEATVFDCLFSDIYSLTREHTRMNDGRPLPDFYRDENPSWKEWYTSGGVLIKREICRHFPSGDSLVTILDGQDRVTEVRVFSAKKKMASQTLVIGKASASDARVENRKA